MKKPTRKWHCGRIAVLDRAKRAVIEPLEILYTIHFAVCVYYLVGFLQFKFIRDVGTLTTVEGAQLLSVSAAGILVPILTGAVMTLRIASGRLQHLTNE